MPYINNLEDAYAFRLYILRILTEYSYTPWARPGAGHWDDNVE